MQQYHRNHPSGKIPCVGGTKRINAVAAQKLLVMQFPERKNLLSPWLPVQGLCMMHSFRGVGKTHCSVGVACAVAVGGIFLNWRAKHPMGVLFVDGEMPAVDLQTRISRTLKHLNVVDSDRLISNLKVITPDLQTQSMPDLSTIDGQKIINKHINDDIKLIILDNLSTLMRTGRENEAESWLCVQEWALQMRAIGKSVLFIHNEGKNGLQRGTSKREDVLDTVISLKQPPGYSPVDGACFEVHFSKARGLYGDDVKPIVARLLLDAEGNYVWTTKTLNESNFDKILKLLRDGYSQKDIAAELDITKGYVSKLVKKAKKSGDYKP